MAAKKKARRKARAPKAAKRKNTGVKMRKAPRGWIKAKAVRTIRRGGRTIVEVKR